MTEAAALPLALSDLVAALDDRGLLAATITAGQAFGGDVEAVNVPSALALAALVVGADVTIVGPGPGVVGTGTALGAGALELAGVVDVAAALGGQPIVALRFSERRRSPSSPGCEPPDPRGPGSGGAPRQPARCRSGRMPTVWPAS